MNPARRPAFPVRLAPLALLLGAALLTAPAAQAAPGASASAAAKAAAPARASAAEQAAMTRGRTLLRDFYAVRLDGLWGAFSPGVRSQWGTLESFRSFRRDGLAQYGPERQVVQERTFTRGPEVFYVRSAAFEKAPELVWAVVLGFTGTQVTTFGIALEEDRSDAPVALRRTLNAP
ncbi:hypothetical protein [Deinococcus knuensis]|uniref:DUF3887 domain-containing protein n=1 Tax=Deinococcus knuensis TaxID=1837380 RepID=A0ABQ2SMU6_9DEIO|nr:hypothetical protein [Deinococcus knuensis]GGS34824.1 hypothetical protein GCM10008961_28140 [Deinococcus knuensis]